MRARRWAAFWVSGKVCKPVFRGVGVEWKSVGRCSGNDCGVVVKVFSVFHAKELLVFCYRRLLVFFPIFGSRRMEKFCCRFQKAKSAFSERFLILRKENPVWEDTKRLHTQEIQMIDLIVWCAESESKNAKCDQYSSSLLWMIVWKTRNGRHMNY